MACGETRQRQRVSLHLGGGALGEELQAHLYDVEELVPVDAAVSVHVVQFEIPAQFVLHLSPHHQAESGDVLHKVYVAILQKQGVHLSQTHLSYCTAEGKLFQDAGLSPGPV